MNAGDDGIWSEDEYWAKQPNIKRLSTKVPGLGNATGKIDPFSRWMNDAVAIDKDVAEMVRRLKAPVSTYLVQILKHQEELLHGCETPVGDRYPYYRP